MSLEIDVDGTIETVIHDTSIAGHELCEGNKLGHTKIGVWSNLCDEGIEYTRCLHYCALGRRRNAPTA